MLVAGFSLDLLWRKAFWFVWALSLIAIHVERQNEQFCDTDLRSSKILIPSAPPLLNSSPLLPMSNIVAAGSEGQTGPAPFRLGMVLDSFYVPEWLC